MTTQEPRTAAGRSLLSNYCTGNPTRWPKTPETMANHIAAIEAEAAAAARAEGLGVREALEALTSTLESITFHVGVLGMRIEKDDSFRLAEAHAAARAALDAGGGA